MKKFLILVALMFSANSMAASLPKQNDELSMFVKQWVGKSFKKDDFDTKADIEQKQMAYSGKQFSITVPVKLVEHYSFMRYDADTQVLTATLEGHEKGSSFAVAEIGEYSGQGPDIDNYLSAFDLFVFKKTNVAGRSYVGTNAFGVKRQIKVSSTYQIGVIFVNLPQTIGRYRNAPVATAKLEPATAKRIFANGKWRFTFVTAVGIKQNDAVIESTETHTPTIDEPYHHTKTTYGITAVVTKAELVDERGEVVATVSNKHLNNWKYVGLAARKVVSE